MRVRALVPVLLLAAACSGGSSFAQPRSDAFSPGACRELAPPVLQLGKDLHALGSKTPDPGQADAIKAAQARVRALQDQATGTLQPAVQKLVTTIGILRIRNDTDSYDASLARDAMTAYRELVDACTRS
ncbi:MAG: hypothetical protein JWO22_1065 [Frankiales bacterium]|nr:hypothetical protein [Frankiales bacterium]